MTRPSGPHRYPSLGVSVVPVGTFQKSISRAHRANARSTTKSPENRSIGSSQNSLSEEFSILPTSPSCLLCFFCDYKTQRDGNQTNSFPFPVETGLESQSLLQLLLFGSLRDSFSAGQEGTAAKTIPCLRVQSAIQSQF